MIWNGEQFQTVDEAAVAKLLGLPAEQVRIHQLYAGGSFGRRANPKSDFVHEAAAIAKATNGTAPVKLSAQLHAPQVTARRRDAPGSIHA